MTEGGKENIGKEGWEGGRVRMSGMGMRVAVE